MFIDFLMFIWILFGVIIFVSLYSSKRDDYSGSEEDSYFVLAGLWVFFSFFVAFGIKEYCSSRIRQYVEKHKYYPSRTEISKFVVPKAEDFAFNCVALLKSKDLKVRNSYEGAVDYCLDECRLCRKIYKTLRSEVFKESMEKCRESLKFVPICNSLFISEEEIFEKERDSACVSVAKQVSSDAREIFREEVIKKLKEYLSKEDSRAGGVNPPQSSLRDL